MRLTTVTSARWQSLSDWPLIGAAVLFLVAYKARTVEAAADRSPSPSTNGRAHLPPLYDPEQGLERRSVG